MTGTREATPTGAWLIGDLRVNAGQVRVTRAGIEIPLPRLSFDLLLALAEAAPNLLTTEQLLERVWPGLVVNAETVAQRVKLLRAALGDDPRAPRYLQVVRGRGYRLVAEVRREPAVVEDSPSSLVPPTSAVSASPPSRRRWAIIAAATLAAGLAAWAAIALRGAPAVPESAPGAAIERSVAVLPFQNLGALPDDRALAFGLAEAVLHQLANLKDLVVIARTSSFALADQQLDARRIGARLDARYILEGSVQRIGTQLRVTAQLVDTGSGAHVWSLQFDRGTRDIFAVQDEIALKVAQALELSLDATTSERLAARRTTSFDAYFELLQARSLLASDRIDELRDARDHLERAIRLDAGFADAMVDLAGVELRLAEFEFGGDRRARVQQATERASALLERALGLDPRNSRALLQRGYLRAFSDLAGAEADYRQGLALAPNDASGYEGLAAVLDRDPQRQDEVLQALDRAHRLDPIEPRYQVTKAVFLLYRRSDLRGAESILQQVIEQHPRYVPALQRLGEVKLLGDEMAEAIRYLELAVQLDPSAEWPVRMLIGVYLDLGDVAAAESVRRQAGGEVAARDLSFEVYRSDWLAAGETAYQALRDGSVTAWEENVLALALRRHARVTGDQTEAIETMEALADISWTAAGEPVVRDSMDLKSYVVGVADLLQLTGERERARRLLRALVAAIDHESQQLGRGTLWTQWARACSLALLGDTDGAIADLRAQQANHRLLSKHWMHLERDPAFDGLRERPGFREVVAATQATLKQQQARLAQLRQEGLVPERK